MAISLPMRRSAASDGYSVMVLAARSWAPSSASPSAAAGASSSTHPGPSSSAAGAAAAARLGGAVPISIWRSAASAIWFVCCVRAKTQRGKELPA